MQKYCPLFLSSEKTQIDYCLKDSCAWWNEETEKCGIIKSAEKGPNTKTDFKEIQRRLQQIEYNMMYSRAYALENKPPKITCISIGDENNIPVVYYNSEEQKRVYDTEKLN